MQAKIRQSPQHAGENDPVHWILSSPVAHSSWLTLIHLTQNGTAGATGKRFEGIFVFFFFVYCCRPHSDLASDGTLLKNLTGIR